MAATTNNKVCVSRPSDDEELTEMLRNLGDAVKTSSQISFKREFGLLKSKIPQPGLSPLWAHQKEMAPVIQRCCQEKKFWPGDELEYLISVQCVSPRNIQMVFETLSERKEVGMMYRALKSQPGIPEDCLIIALQCFLTAEEKTLQKALDDCVPSSDQAVNSVSSLCPITKARSTFVDQVLGAYNECDETYLIASLKKLPFTSVVTFLQYILHRMKNSEDQKQVDLLSQWKGHLIDAHATQLVISKDAHELLIQLSKEDEVNKQFVDLATDDLMPLLKVAMMTNTDKGHRSMGQYCIEMLRL